MSDLPHSIAFRQTGTDQHNAYEIVFQSDTRPERSDAMGASINSSDGVTKEGDAYVASGGLGGGIDAYDYGGSRGKMEFDRPGDVEVNVNDEGWQPGSDYARLVERGGDSGGTTPSDRDDRDDDPPREDDSYDGTTVIPTTDEMVEIENERPGLGVVSRPVSTIDDVEIHVERGREIEALQQAFNSLPFKWQHEIRVYVHGRTRDGNTAHIHGVDMANHIDFVVDGSDGGVINNGGVNVSVGGKLDHVQFQNLRFEFLSQCKDARFVDCVILGNGNSAFSGKMGGKMLIDCVIGDGSDDYGIASIGNEMVEIRNCEINASETAVRGTAASIHTFTGDNEINAPQKYGGYANAVHASGRRLDN